MHSSMITTQVSRVGYNRISSDTPPALSVIPFTVAGFNECLTNLNVIPTSTRFHRAISMLNTAFITKRLCGGIWLTPAGDSQQLIPLRPFVECLSKVYFTTHLSIHYEIEDVRALKGFDDILQLEPDCCDSLVMRIYDWIIGRKRD